nr:hypothetical protein RVX_1952 [Nitratidesulfovibrio sp. HK-II]
MSNTENDFQSQYHIKQRPHPARPRALHHGFRFPVETS